MSGPQRPPPILGVEDPAPSDGSPPPSRPPVAPARPGEEWLRLAQLAELGVLSASLLHELRQPLFAVKAVAQLARRGDRTLEGAELDQLLVHLQQIEELLDHYAGYGRIAEPNVLYDLNESAQSAIDMLAHRRRHLRADLVAELSEQPLLVHGRPSAARQVVANLLQNALDAIEGRPERRIEIRTSRGESEVLLSVSDSGSGIPGDIRGRLFEPFVTSKPPGRGTGLGLYVAQQLVREAGGDLTVRDRDGGGTAVLIRLPRRVR